MSWFSSSFSYLLRLNLLSARHGSRCGEQPGDKRTRILPAELTSSEGGKKYICKQLHSVIPGRLLL